MGRRKRKDSESQSEEEMMKSLLYHAFGVRGYRYLATRYEKGTVIFEIEPEDVPDAVQNGNGSWVRNGFRWRKVRGVSIGLKPVWLMVKIQKWTNTATDESIEQSPLLSQKEEGFRGAWNE